MRSVEFGVFMKAYARNLDAVAEVEALGFSEVWFPDFQLLGGDPYVWMALAASRSERLRFSVSVSNPATRHVAVVANAMATLNMVFPGRVSVGLGTGSAPLKAMGIPAATAAELEEFALACRQLLRGEASAPVGGGKPLRFLRASAGALRTDPPVPVRIAAGGPRALQAAGRVADDVIIGTVDPGLLAAQIAYVRAGAEEAGRRPPTISVLAALCLDPPDELDAVVDLVGGYVPNMLFGNHRIPQLQPDCVSPGLRSSFANAVEALRANAAAPKEPGSGSGDYETYLRQLPDWQRRLVTWEAIRAKTLIGGREEVGAQLDELTAVGVQRVVLYPDEHRPDAFQRFAAEHLHRAAA